MNLCWIVLTDGRKNYIQEALPTWIEHYDSIDNKFIIDDSGDTEYTSWLKNTFPSFEIIPVENPRQGYANAVQRVFKLFRDTGLDYCLHLEDDFILSKTVDIENIVYVLDKNPNLSQMAIMRQPWYHNEIESGGVIDAIKGEKFYDINTDGFDWVKHRAFYTCNPNIFPQWLTNYEWPDGNWSESKFGRLLFSNNKDCGIWGNRSSWPQVEHIGRERNGIEY
jgi:hypothetical protein